MKNEALIQKLREVTESVGNGTPKNTGGLSNQLAQKETDSSNLLKSNRSLEEVKQALSRFETDITFVNNGRTYMLRNKDGEVSKSLSSVTKVLSLYKPAFEADIVATRIAKKKGITKEMVLAEWAKGNDMSTAYGTCVHYAIECYYNNVPFTFEKARTLIRTKTPLVDREWEEIKDKALKAHDFFLRFVEDKGKYLQPVGQEFVVGDLDYTGVCGTVDMIVYNKLTQEVELYDFKTNKKIRNSKQSYGNRMLPPLSNLFACEQTEYALQLNMYRLIIERNTGLDISKTNLLWINPEANESYVNYELDDMRQEADVLLKDFWRNSLMFS